VRERERERGGDGERGAKGRRKRGGTRGRTAPYLRNFKLNCDVFKLTFLPARPRAHSPSSLSLALFSSIPSPALPAAPSRSFLLALPAAFQLEARARLKVETCDITAGFFHPLSHRFSISFFLSLPLSLSLSFSIHLSVYLRNLRYSSFSLLISLAPAVRSAEARVI